LPFSFFPMGAMCQPISLHLIQSSTVHLYRHSFDRYGGFCMYIILQGRESISQLWMRTFPNSDVG
jgi:hypothetical protein